jgi:hypothetical protein
MITSWLGTGINRVLVLPVSHIDSFDNSNSSQQFDSMALFTLHKDGLIESANCAGSKLLGCEFGNNTWQPISKFIPQLQGVELIQSMRINQNLRFLSRIGFLFEVFDVSGIEFDCKLFFNECQDLGMDYLRLIVRPIIPDYLKESF